MKRNKALKPVSKTVKNGLYAVSVLYAVVLVYVLFLRSFGVDYAWTYTEYLQAMSNFIPLKSVHVLLTTPALSARIIIRFLINFVGNIALFVLWGFFVPFYTSKLRQTKQFALFTLLIVLAIETTQLFAMLGSFDVEDILLNLLGALAGFGVWKLRPYIR